MQNVDSMGETKLRINWDYVTKLEEKLRSVQEDTETNWNKNDIRKLIQRIRMLKKHLTKKGLRG